MRLLDWIWENVNDGCNDYGIDDEDDDDELVGKLMRKTIVAWEFIFQRCCRSLPGRPEGKYAVETD